jgi:uncharacterized protein YkwD
MRQTLLVLLAVVLALPTLASEITRDSVLASMNAERIVQGLAPLRLDDRLDAACDDRIHDMEELQYWAHDSPDGRAPFVWLKPRGYFFQAAGENLACGFESTELLVSSWMESPGHRANIMSPDYQDCGIAIIDGSTKGRATGKSIVVLFGRPLPGAPSVAHK